MSRIEYKKTFIRCVYLDVQVYQRKLKDVYSFDYTVEIARYNAWLDQVQWLNQQPVIGLFIPDAIDSETHFQR